MSVLLHLLGNQQFKMIAVVQLLNVFSTSLLAPVLPVYFKQQGMSESQIGLIMGIISLGALIVRPWSGISVDTKGCRTVTLFGQALTAAGLACYLLASGFWQYLLIRFYQGIALAFYGTGSVTYVSGVENPENTSAAIAYFSLCTMIGMGIATSVAPAIFAGSGFFNLIYLGLASISIATILMWLKGKELTFCSEGNRIPFREVLRAREVSAPSICLFGSSFALGTAFTFVPLVAISHNLTTYTVFFIGFSAAVVFSRAAVHQINSLWSSERTAFYASLINACGTGLLAIYPSTITFIVSGMLIGFGFGIIYPTLAAYVVEKVSAANKGAALSVIAAASDVGNALGAAVLGVVAETMGFSALFAITTCISLFSGFYFYRTLWDAKKMNKCVA